MTDLTAPRDIDPALAELETLWTKMPTGVVLTDARSGRVIRTNPAADAMLRAVASGDVDTPDAYRAFHLDGRPMLADEWPTARTFANGETVVDELIEFESNDGSRRVFSVTSVPVEEDGVIVAGLALFDDVTQHERRERAARDFLTNAAHELQTPLAAITSAIEVLQAGAKETPVERDRFLLHIEHAVTRLGRLAQALLVLSRAQAGLEQPRSELVELGPFLNEIASQAARPVAVECRPRIAVLTNRVLLEQAVTNLVDNALKHAGEGVVLRGELEGRRATIVVGDSGTGIPPAHQPQIFERFFRTGERAGFGLGLAIVREVVDVLGGELRLASDASGTHVSITLTGARMRAV